MLFRLTCLAPLLLMPAAATAQTDPVAECHRLAANPYDAERLSPGVAFEDIEAAAAITACLQAVDANPNDARLVYQLGRAYDASGDFLSAENAYLRSVDLGFPVAMRNLGFLYRDAPGDKADPTQAERWFRRAADAGDTTAMNELAWMWVVAGTHLREAATLAHRAVEAEPEDADFLDTLGWIYFRQGKLDEAAAATEHAIRVAPDAALFHAHLGWIYDALGRGAEARASWQRALDLPAKDAGDDPTFDRDAIEAKLEEAAG